MKVLHLLYAHTIGGAEKYLYYLLPHMAEEGIESHIFIVTTPGSKTLFSTYRDQFTQAGIKSSFMVSTHRGFLKVAKSVSEYMKDNDIHYLHSHLSNSDLIAMLTKLLYNKKIRTISTKHGYHEDILRMVPEVKNAKELNKIGRHSLYYYVSKLMISKTDYNYAVSKALAKLFADMGLSKTEMPFIHNGVELKPTISSGSEKNFRVAEMQLIIVGRLEKVKGHFYLMEAMVKVAEKYPNIRLLVIGDGSQKETLITQVNTLGIADQVVFMGFHKDPYSYIQHSDVIILPSLFDSFGLVYIEAFALETPVVAFDTPAGNELIENNKTGLLVAAKDSIGLADKIIYLLENPLVAKNIATAAKEKYDVYFSSKRMVKETADFYKKIDQAR